MKKYSLLVILAIIFLVQSCNAQPSGDPAQATIDYLTALVEKDKTALVNLSCKSWEEQAGLEADALLSVGAELNDVSCSVVGEQDGLTTVQCTGVMDLTYGEEIRSIDLEQRTYSLAIEDSQWRVCSYR